MVRLEGLYLVINKSAYYDLLDERQGIWTTIHHERNCVVFRRKRSHRLGLLVGFMACIFVVYLFVSLAISDGTNLFMQCSSAIAAAITMAIGVRLIRGQVKKMGNPYLIVFDREASLDINSQATQLLASQINCIELRENSGRDVEDLAMWQIYVHMLDQDRAILVFQCIKWNSSRVMELAEQLAKRWRVSLVPPVKH